MTRTHLEMALPAVPRIKGISEAVIDKPRGGTNKRQAQESTEPSVAWRAVPNLYCAVSTDIKIPLIVDAVQTAANVSESFSVLRQSIRFEIDVAELDNSVARCARQPVALPVDSTVTDRTSGVVPDG